MPWQDDQPDVTGQHVQLKMVGNIHPVTVLDDVTDGDNMPTCLSVKHISESRFLLTRLSLI